MRMIIAGHQTKDYLGDSVYADFDGYHIVLTTENGYHDDPRNQIAMEPQVLSALDRYRARLKVLCDAHNAELAALEKP
jgi:hypothetical protein